MNSSSLAGGHVEGHKRTSDPAAMLTHPLPHENEMPRGHVTLGMQNRNFEIVALVFFSVLVLGALECWLLPMRWLVTIVADDCFYYFKIAQNLAATGILTFDGVNPTNGFHPGWMLVLVGLLRVLPSDLTQDTVARALLFVQWPFLASAVALLVTSRLPRPTLASSAFTVLCILGVPFIRPISMGLETALAFFFMALFWLALARYLNDPSIAPWQVGLWGAFWEFARLDSVMIIGSASILAVAYVKTLSEVVQTTSYRQCLKSLFLMVGPAIAVFMAVAAFNKVYFGNYLTVSAYIKSGFGMPSLGFVTQQLHYPLVALSILAFGIWLLKRGGETAPAARMLCIMTGAVLVYCAVFPWLLKYSLDASWYYYGVVGLALVAARLAWCVAGTFAAYARLARLVLVLSAAMAAAASWAYFATRPIFFTECYDLALKAKELPPGSILAFSDSGSVGFFSGHPTINTDGVANSFAFLDAISNGTVAEFLKRSGVTHLVARMPDSAILESGAAFYSVKGRHGAVHTVPQMPVRKSNLVYTDPNPASVWKLSIFKAHYN